jgi:hypothetical protein
MKSLKGFKPVMDALAQIASEATLLTDNGTYGKEYICHFWDEEDTYDKERATIEVNIARLTLKGKYSEIADERKKLEGLPPAKKNFIFKLLEPINRLNGTKIQLSDGKTYSPRMENVEYIYVPAGSLEADLFDYEEREESTLDRQGRETPIITLRLTKGMIDVKEGELGWDNKERRAPRAYVTPISFRAMQIAGKTLRNEDNAKRSLYGYDQI